MIEPLTTRRLAAWLLGLCLILATIAPRSADAHGIAGNRLFPGTLAIDDPAVNDESRLPLFLSAKHPGQGGDVDDNRFSWSFFRLLTPTLAAGVAGGLTGIGGAPSGPVSIGPAFRSRARCTGTTCTRPW